MVAIGMSGGTLYLIGLLEKYGMKVNEEAISFIDRIGGALGYRLVYCTQYPTASSGQEENYL